MLQTNKAQNLGIPLIRIHWQFFWFLGVLLTLAIIYQVHLKRIAGNVFFLFADQAQSRHNYSEAFWWVEVAYRAGVGQSANYNQAGLLASQLGKSTAEDHWFQQALLAPNRSASALNNNAVRMLEVGDRQQARTELELAANSAPNNAIIHYNLGLLLQLQGNVTEAERVLKEVTYIDDQWELPYLQLSAQYLGEERFAEAEKMARKAIQINPYQLNAHHALIGALQAQSKKSSELLAACESALVYFPQDSRLRLYLALFARDNGEQARALQILYELYPATFEPVLHKRVAREIHQIRLQGNQ